ncbi:tetratricopeptide repeat protein [Actinocrispum wychmicini]|uniref:Tetratricopeptide repeat protein n=1 Tax=Actinocrispum wychmicini TaxID=1213861 RepID=A0A4R2IIJ4_9PSEU|nr:tetratricopeptide repeat protein [Actinocrispum wychmicini]TCO44724.1 tetratricopeptide repeat protein [Actinocrispum wychmicini]
MLDPLAEARRRLGLAGRFADEGRFGDAIAVAETALSVAEQTRIPNHPAVADSLILLSRLHEAVSRYDKAERYAKRSIVITEEYSRLDEGLVRLRVAALSCLAGVERIRNRLGSAEVLYSSALELAEDGTWPTPTEQVNLMCGLATVYQYGSRFAEAERMLQQAVALIGQGTGPAAAVVWHHLAMLDLVRGRFTSGESYAARALGLRERRFPPNHPAVANDQVTLASFLSRVGKLDASERLFRRAISTLERVLPEYHYDLAVACAEFAMLMAAKGNMAAAGRLTQRALNIRTQLLGRDHPEVQQTIDDLAQYS